MEPSILLLPAELKRHIIELSSGSPNSLAALARTHTSFQREAEKALYNTLCISASSDNSLKCLETLATNSEKAAWVRFLIIEFVCDNTIENRRATSYLSKSLINMHSLSDFRVRTCCDEVEEKMIEGLGKILCQSHFRLQTFYCFDVLDISRIIKSQTELQILALYDPDTLKNILKTLKELHNAQLFLPIVVILECECDSFIRVPNHISIFPAFYSLNRRATIHQVLTQSFRKDQGNYMLADTKDVDELSVYLFDSSDMPSIYALAKDMAVSFPQIKWLNLWFERRCEIPPQAIKEEISFFSKLCEVNTFVWPTA